MRIDAVFFDLGETIINEGEIWGGWADWLGVPRHTFLAVLGAEIAVGGSFRAAFEQFRPGFDVAEEERLRIAAGVPNTWGAADLYPDARACLAALRAAGLTVGLAGNQPVAAEAIVASLGLDVDIVGISDVWGVQKPAPEFFARMAAEAGLPPERILYVGDRLDNDVAPALKFGMPVAHLRRGPWGHVQRDAELLARCTFRLNSLAELPDLVATTR